jgi:3-oxoacyl-[acyl-carrier protein] reductase
MAKMNRLERLGTPEDIAAALAFLVGPDGSWINARSCVPTGDGLSKVQLSLG